MSGDLTYMGVVARARFAEAEREIREQKRHVALLDAAFRTQNDKLFAAQERIRVLEAEMRAEYIVSEEPINTTNLGPIQSLDVRELAAAHDRGIRAQALEEAAKVVEEGGPRWGNTRLLDIAAAIRALKERS